MKIKKNTFAVLGIILLIILRFSFLEMDAPYYNLTGINQTDEHYYCHAAIEKLNDKYVKLSNRPCSGGFLFIHNHFITKLSLDFFGINFIGLRFPVVIVSLIIISILGFLVKKLLPTNNRMTFLIFVVYLFVDFQFFVYSRYQTPQIYSILWITLIMLFVWLTIYRNEAFIIISVILTVLMITLVYPYNLFIGPALGSFIISLFYKRRKIRILIYTVIGLLLSIILFIGIIHFYGFTIDSYVCYFKQYNKIRDESVGIYDWRIILQIAYTNIYRFNPLLFVLTIFFIVGFVFNYKKRTFFELFVFLSLIFAFFQSNLIISYPFKKWIVLYPLSLVALPYILAVDYRQLNNIKKIIIGIVFFISLFISIVVVRITNSISYWNWVYSSNNIFEIDLIPSWLIVIINMSTVVFICYFIIIIGYNKLLKGSILMLILIIPNLFFQYIYLNKMDFTRVDDLKKLDVLNNQVLLGSYSHAFIFYTNSIPLFNNYDLKNGYINNADSILKEVENLDVYYLAEKRKLDKAKDTLIHYNVIFKKVNLENETKSLILYKKVIK